MIEHPTHGRVQPLIFSYFTQPALSLGRLTLWQYEFTLLNTKRVPPGACKSALLPKVGPRDCWRSDMIHETQREEVAEMGVGSETQALEGIESQVPGAKENLTDHLA